MSEKKHSILKTVITTAAIGTSAYAGASYYFFRNIFDTEVSRALSDDLHINNKDHMNWLSQIDKKDEYIKSFDGIQLHAIKVMNHPESAKWLIPVHGYRSSLIDMASYIHEADNRGYNVLAPDMRGYGLSGGKYTGLSWPEHYDLISWICWLADTEPNAMIALLGVSMGGSTVMNAIGDYLPPQVKCAVEDSGFSDIKEILTYHLQNKFSVTIDPILPGINYFCKLFLHYSINDISIKHQLACSHTPLMIIHGENDTVVPARMAYDCYYATNSDKEIWMVTGKGHVEANQEENYYNRVFPYIEAHFSH